MVRLVVEVVRVDGVVGVDGVIGVVGVDWVIELDDVAGVDGVVWVLRTKTSQQQQQQQEQLYVLLDHAAARLVKTLLFKLCASKAGASHEGGHASHDLPEAALKTQ